VNVTINKVALQETNASINTLFEGAKPRKAGDEAEDVEGSGMQGTRRRVVPGSSKLKISDVRNLSDDADLIIDSLKAIDYGV
jgi:hypothetical protein